MLLTKYSYEVEPQPLLLLQSELFQVNNSRIQSSGKSGYDRTEFLFKGSPLARHTPLMITFLSMQTTVISGIRFLNHGNCDTYPQGGRQESVI